MGRAAEQEPFASGDDAQGNPRPGHPLASCKRGARLAAEDPRESARVRNPTRGFPGSLRRGADASGSGGGPAPRASAKRRGAHPARARPPVMLRSCGHGSSRPCGRSPRRTPVRGRAAWRGPPCGRRRCGTAWRFARPCGVRWSLASSISREPVARSELPDGGAGLGPGERCAWAGARASRGEEGAAGSGGRADPPRPRPPPARRRGSPAAVAPPRPRRTRAGRGCRGNSSTPTAGAPRSAGGAPTGSPRPGSHRRGEGVP